MSRAHQQGCLERIGNATKRLLVAPSNEGAWGHALGSNLSFTSQAVFDWLDELFEARCNFA